MNGSDRNEAAHESHIKPYPLPQSRNPKQIPLQRDLPLLDTARFVCVSGLHRRPNSIVPLPAQQRHQQLGMQKTAVRQYGWRWNRLRRSFRHGPGSSEPRQNRSCACLLHFLLRFLLHRHSFTSTSRSLVWINGAPCHLWTVTSRGASGTGHGVNSPCKPPAGRRPKSSPGCWCR